MIRVANFQGKEKGMKYYYTINENIKQFGDPLKINANYFIISSDNYITLFKTKDEQEYISFFKKTFFKE